MISQYYEKPMSFFHVIGTKRLQNYYDALEAKRDML